LAYQLAERLSRLCRGRCEAKNGNDGQRDERPKERACHRHPRDEQTRIAISARKDTRLCHRNVGKFPPCSLPGRARYGYLDSTFGMTVGSGADFSYTAQIVQKTTVRLAVCAFLTVAAKAQEPTANALMKQSAVRAALDAVKANEPQTVLDQIRFCEIPAPSFK